MSDKKKISTTEQKMMEVQASFVDSSPILEPATQAEATTEVTWPQKQLLVQNSNHQYQVVSQDNTTISNLFRSETKGWKDFLFKLATELLLSVIEPDRFLKNAKAIALLTIVYIFLKLDYVQIKELFELYLNFAK